MQPTAIAAPRPQCDCTAMQPTAMAAPRPQCDCTAMQLTAARRPQCDCHAATAMAAPRPHGSTEAAMRLPWQQPRADWQHRGRNATVMQPTAMAAPRPQCDCTAMQPTAMAAPRPHGSTEAAMRLGRNATARRAIRVISGATMQHHWALQPSQQHDRPLRDGRRGQPRRVYRTGKNCPGPVVRAALKGNRGRQISRDSRIGNRLTGRIAGLGTMSIDTSSTCRAVRCSPPSSVP